MATLIASLWQHPIKPLARLTLNPKSKAITKVIWLLRTTCYRLITSFTFILFICLLACQDIHWFNLAFLLSLALDAQCEPSASTGQWLWSAWMKCNQLAHWIGLIWPSHLARSSEWPQRESRAKRGKQKSLPSRDKPIGRSLQATAAQRHVCANILARWPAITATGNTCIPSTPSSSRFRALVRLHRMVLKWTVWREAGARKWNRTGQVLSLKRRCKTFHVSIVRSSELSLAAVRAASSFSEWPSVVVAVAAHELLSLLRALLLSL